MNWKSRSLARKKMLFLRCGRLYGERQRLRVGTADFFCGLIPAKATRGHTRIAGSGLAEMINNSDEEMEKAK